MVERVAESTDLNCHTEALQDVAYFFNLTPEQYQSLYQAL